MQPERWKKIESIFLKALDHDEAGRAAVIEDSCAGDESLQREVESLLAHHGNARDFIEMPVFELSDVGKTEVREQSPVALSPGMRLGDYEIQKLIGSGGMGEVYRARDTRLGREVAIKVLPPYVSGDADRLRRFEQEAKATAALNHPNILAVHQLGTYQGAPYLISELLEGSTLRDQLMRGPLPVRKAIDYGVQIARGLAAAHEKGIVHRDLKPENLFVTKDGRVKILDFGLAKLIQTPSFTRETTLTAQTGTEPGVVLGTVGYMSPEQVRGNPADHRSDIFAFGAILYEMLSGRRAFQKPTSAETMSAILNEDPQPVSQTAINLPPALQRVVQRCLEKSPEQRFQSASDLAFALEALSESGSTSSRAVSPEIRQVPWKWIVACATAIVVIAGAITWYLTPTPQPRVTGSTQLTNASNPGPNVTDGSRLYFTDIRPTGWVIAEMSINGGDVSVIPTVVKNPVVLDISPDHTHLLVGSEQPGDSPLWSQPLPSGSPRQIGDLRASWAAWSPDGKQLVYTTGTDVCLANADGSNRRTLASFSKEGSPILPYFSPDGTRIRFTQFRSGADRLWEVRSDGTNLHPLLPGWNTSSSQCCGEWTPDGRYYVFMNENTVDNSLDLFALRESQGLMHRSSSSPTRLTFGPLDFSAFTVTANGKRMFVSGQQGRGELVHYDTLSKQLLPFLGGISATHAAFSRDGKWVAYMSIPDGFLWRSGADGSERLQLTFGPGHSYTPSWSPDGKSIAFIWKHSGKPAEIYVIAADGGSPRLLVPGNSSISLRDPSWSADGGQLAFATTGYPLGDDEHGTIEIVDVKTGKISSVPGSNGTFNPHWSPDGRYLAALSLNEKKLMLYDFHLQSWRTLVVDDLGIAYPAWTTDSRSVQYVANPYLNPEFKRVRLGGSKPEALFSMNNLHIYRDPVGPWISVAPDNSVILTRDISSTGIYALDVDFP